MYETITEGDNLNETSDPRRVELQVRTGNDIEQPEQNQFRNDTQEGEENQIWNVLYDTRQPARNQFRNDTDQNQPESDYIVTP